MSKEFLEQINNGVSPFSNQNDIIKNYDMEKLRYNSFYKSFSCVASSFPDGWQNLNGFNKVIQEIAENRLSPLEEIQLRKEEIKEEEKQD
jgi:hypothetical protein